MLWLQVSGHIEDPGRTLPTPHPPGYRATEDTGQASPGSHPASLVHSPRPSPGVKGARGSHLSAPIAGFPAMIVLPHDLYPANHRGVAAVSDLLDRKSVV